MSIIRNRQSLCEAIAHLENDQRSEWDLLKEHFQFTLHSLNPVNMIKEKFNETISSSKFQGKILQSVLGLATGFLSSRFIIGPSPNIFQKVLATAVQTGVSRVTVEPQAIKNSGKSILKNVLTKMKID